MEKKVYSYVDIFKLLFSILIVFMHTYCYDLGVVGEWIKNVIASYGVPFFFITSGFFLRLGLDKSKGEKQYIKHYFVRALLMYVLWSVITTPVLFVIIEATHKEYSLVAKIAYAIRCYLFSGTIGIYWYLLSLVYNCIIIFLVRGKEQGRTTRLFFAFILSIILFIIGVLYNAERLPSKNLTSFIHAVFGSERNNLNVGLFYMMVGYLLVDISWKVKPYISAVLVILFTIVDTFFQTRSSFRFIQALVAILLFLTVISLPQLNYNTVRIRKISTAIYLGHFPFILLYDMFLKKGTFIDFSLSIIFSISLYVVLNRMLPNKISGCLYGRY